MNKADLVDQVADAIGPGITKRECKLVVDGFLAAVRAALARGEHIELRGFGSLGVRHRKARTAHNPRTGEPVEVSARVVPVFRPSKQLIRRVDWSRPPPDISRGESPSGSSGGGPRRLASIP